MPIDRLTLCVAISSLISTISLIEKSGMELGVVVGHLPARPLVPPRPRAPALPAAGPAASLTLARSATQEWMSSPFQRYFKYPALLACAMIFMAPRWTGGDKKEEDSEAAAEGIGSAASAEDEMRAASGRPSGAGPARPASSGGTGGSKKRRVKALRAGKTG